MNKSLGEQIAEIRKAIGAQGNLRAVLGEEVTNTTLAALQEQLAYLESQLPAQENRKLATILFGDIFGFTAIVEKMDPEEVMKTMNLLWDELDRIIRQNGGYVDKHVGDNVMAIWGVDSAREDNPERAVRAALEMQSALERGIVRIPIRMRIGIHTGPVMLGSVGTTREFTAIGHTVNLANRLQEIAPVSGVLISLETQQLVRGLYEFEEVSVSAGKDPTLKQTAYLVLRAQPHIFRPRTRGVQGVETRMIGREQEIKQLQDALQFSLREHKAQAFTIIGEAGIGKSRLLYEFQNWLEKQNLPIDIFKARATERSARTPYALLRDLFALKFDIQDSDSLPIARDKLERGIQQIDPADGNALEKAHFIGELIGMDFSSSPYLRGILSDPAQIRDRALHHFEQIVAEAARRGFVLILIEDLHWADENSMEAFTRIIQLHADLPLLIVFLARPTLLERRSNWGAGIDPHTTIRLAPLPETHSRALVDEILQKTRSVPEALRTIVVQGAEGNPYYVEELIKMLISDGVIVIGETWRVDESKLKEARIPSTLTGILQARLDSLPDNERAILQCASVIGRTFWDDTVQVLNGSPKDEIHAALQSLTGRELVFPRAAATFSGTQEYIFKHNILRAVTYETVLKRQRKKYHGQAAEWIVRHSSDRAGEYAAIVAEHFEQAEKFREAAVWSARAGKQAVDSYAPGIALEYYDRAFHFAERINLPDRETIGWYHERGIALMARARFADAAENYRALLAVAEQAGDLIAQALAWNEISFIQDNEGDIPATLKSAEKAEAIAKSAGEAGAGQWVKSLYNKGWAVYRQGDGEQAKRLGEEALRLIEARPSFPDARRETAQVMQLLGAAYEMLGQFDRSVACEQNALDAYRAIGNRRGEAAMLNNQGVGAYVRGENAAAVARYQEAIEAAHKIGSRDRVLIFTSNLAGAQIRQAEFAEAEKNLRWVIESIGKEVTQYLPQTHTFLALACLGQGKTDEALALAQKALDMAKESGQSEMIAECWRALGQCAAEAAGQPAPRACYAESLRLYTEIGLEAEQARTLRIWGMYESRAGDQIKEDELLLQAKKIFEKLGFDQ
jgi:class 3 adenylate cyclase